MGASVWKKLLSLVGVQEKVERVVSDPEVVGPLDLGYGVTDFSNNESDRFTGPDPAEVEVSVKVELPITSKFQRHVEGLFAAGVSDHASDPGDTGGSGQKLGSPDCICSAVSVSSLEISG